MPSQKPGGKGSSSGFDKVAGAESAEKGTASGNIQRTVFWELGKGCVCKINSRIPEKGPWEELAKIPFLGEKNGISFINLKTEQSLSLSLLTVITWLKKNNHHNV